MVSRKGTAAQGSCYLPEVIHSPWQKGEVATISQNNSLNIIFFSLDISILLVFLIVPSGLFLLPVFQRLCNSDMFNGNGLFGS